LARCFVVRGIHGLFSRIAAVGPHMRSARPTPCAAMSRAESAASLSSVRACSPAGWA